MSSSASFDIQDPYKSLLVYPRQMAHRTRTSQESSYHNLMNAGLKCTLLSPLQVTVEDGKVFVTAKKKVLTLPAVTKHKQHLELRMISAFLILF